MSLAHQIPFMDQQVRHDNWEARYEHKGTELKGKTLGLIGLGRIGSLVARKATNGFDMKVIAYDEFLVKNEYAGFVNSASSMEEVLAKSDFVSLHVPVTAETIEMINQETLRLMKPNAYLINCARGELINEEALHEALKSGVINGAALDVFQEEPIAHDHPFFELDNLIMTPHNAIITHEAMDLMGYHAAV
jgi:D-3-phosphoglycerate dehydrogenase